MTADFSQEPREALLECNLLVARWKKFSVGKNATLLP